MAVGRTSKLNCSRNVYVDLQRREYFSTLCWCSGGMMLKVPWSGDGLMGYETLQHFVDGTHQNYLSILYICILTNRIYCKHWAGFNIKSSNISHCWLNLSKNQVVVFTVNLDVKLWILNFPREPWLLHVPNFTLNFKIDHFLLRLYLLECSY
jgi:hypothetical protein